MGVMGLSAYVRVRSQLGEPVEIHGKVLFDGHSLAHFLYHRSPFACETWPMGGEYAVFRQQLTDFFTQLGITCRPIVLMDGVSPLHKQSERLKRAENKIMKAAEVVRAIKAPVVHGTWSEVAVLPPWVLQTFLQTLRDEPAVEVLVCDGEADRALALMGNILKVPVISNDSDFFIFPIIGGYVPLNTLHVDDSGAKGRVFYAEKLADHLKIPQHMLPLFATVCGNDYVDDTIRRDLQSRISSRHDRTTRIGRVMGAAATFVGQYNNVDEGVSALLELFDTSSLVRQRAEDCFRISLAQYDLNETNLTVGSTLADVLNYMTTLNGTMQVNDRILSAYRKGQLHFRIIELIARHSFWSDIFLEDPQKATAWSTSHQLRQHLYATCLSPAPAYVTEYVRVQSNYVARIVPLTVTPILTLESARIASRSERCYAMGVALGIDIEANAREWLQCSVLPVLTLRHICMYSDLAITIREAQALLTSILCTCVSLSTTTSTETPSLNVRAVHLYTQLQFSLMVTALLNQALAFPFPDVDAAHFLSGFTAHHYLNMASKSGYRPSDASLCRTCAADSLKSTNFAQMLGTITSVLPPEPTRPNKRSRKQTNAIIMVTKPNPKTSNIYDILKNV